MTSSPPTHPDEFYAQLTMRNRGLIDAQEQAALRRARLVIAGCGSTGGACIMPLVRSGAEHFVLLDPGAFELDNLNRQEATLEDLGLNKAVATGARIRAVNPHATIEIHPEGVVLGAITLQLKPHDIVIDAVDVTSDTGVRAKLALHRAACDLDLKVITAYDIATTQYLELFDYSRISKPLRGRVREPVTSDRVLKALIPPLVLPREIFSELRARQLDPVRPFPQLAMTSTLLGALVVPYVLRILMGRPLRSRIRVDLNDLVRPPARRAGDQIRRRIELASLWWKLRG